MLYFDTSGNPNQEPTGGNDMGEKLNNVKEDLNNDCRQTSEMLTQAENHSSAASIA
jgi:hypothetical protein